MGHRLIENSTWGPRRATILRFVSPVPQRSPKCRRDTEVRLTLTAVKLATRPTWRSGSKISAAVFPPPAAPP